MNGQKNTTKNFTLQTKTGKKLYHDIGDIYGNTVREKLDNAIMKLLELNIDIDNISAMYYNDIAYTIWK